jgi:3-hydroxyisobutyrate dehydrogenase-like beta-hydroxyacid dehydrogenase
MAPAAKAHRGILSEDIMADRQPSVCFIGFGEAGQAIAAGFREEGVAAIAAWDILFPQPDGARLLRAGETIGVRAATSAADAARGADVIVSAVTAASSVEAARSVAGHTAIHDGRAPLYLDINSVSPARKQDTARLLGTSARYIDVAVIAPIHPARHRTPMLLAGADSGAAAPLMTSLGMKVSIAGTEVGAAAAIKMVRGVIIKGIEALTAECFVAAARAGVIDEVAASLKNNYPGIDWAKMVPYNLERMASHGERRAAEMEEVCETLRELGVEPLMTEATVRRQREMGAIGQRPAVRSALNADRTTMLNAISTAARDRH